MASLLRPFVGRNRGRIQVAEMQRQQEERDRLLVQEEQDRQTAIERQAVQDALQGIFKGEPTTAGTQVERLPGGFYMDPTKTPAGRKAAQDQAERERRRGNLIRAGAPEPKVDAILDNPGLADNVLFPPREPQPRSGTVQPGATSPQAMQQALRLQSQYERSPLVKNATTVAENYGRIRAAAENPSAAGDLSLIFGYMKMLDPGSTVREGEFANAQNAAGVPDQVKNAYNRAMSGERLNPEQRADFLDQAERQVESQRRLLQSVMGRYSTIAEKYGVDPFEVVFDPFDVYDMGAEGPSSGDGPPVVNDLMAALQAGGGKPPAPRDSAPSPAGGNPWRR